MYKTMTSQSFSEKEQEAEKLAEFIHFGQKRRSGEDFVEHPKRVARGKAKRVR